MLFNTQSAYSFLQSTLDPKRYVAKGKALGYTSLGLADQGVLHASLTFYQACRQAGIKPLIGMMTPLPGKVQVDQVYPYLLYALDDQGYLALIQVSKAVNASQASNLAWQIIQTYRDHLVLISPGRQGEIEQALLHDDQDKAVAILNQLKAAGLTDHFYLGMSIYPFNKLEAQGLIDFAQVMDLRLVANQAIEALEAEDGPALKVLQALHANETLDSSVFDYRTSHYLYGYQEWRAMYTKQGLGYVLENTEALVDQMDVTIPLNQSLLPHFEPPAEQKAADYLRQLCLQGLDRIQQEDNPSYQDRLDHELSTIEAMGFVDYFLIVWEMLAYCHRQGIRTGPGRGSAAGSLVAYLLQITRVDPIQYDLLFERFLNPERYNMPDIDIDIPDNKRDQVLHYLENRYGHDQVAQLITFGSFGAKQALRDSLRVLGYDRQTQSVWSKAIPQELAISLDQAYANSSDLRSLVAASSDQAAVFDLAKRLEGLPRHTSTHASGVVIGDQPLSTWIPILDRPGQLQITQYAMEEVEAVGLLKMDFLGLRNLQLLDGVLHLIQVNQQQDLDPQAFDQADPETLRLFQQGETLGVFQFESNGIRQVLRQVHPDSFEEIVAVNALYRPGPMQQIRHFIARKHGKEGVDTLHPRLAEILQPTYGIIVYQEQVMQICQVMANFSLGQADLLRRAMGKKQVAIMDKAKDQFIQGALANGFSQEMADKVYHYIYQFANYGFNKAHAVVYSTLAYQLAYLKAHYPLEFSTALVNQGRSQQQSQEDYLRLAQDQVGSFLRVDVNRSLLEFAIEGGQIRIGLMAVKGMRQDFAKAVLNERNLAGPFIDFQDLLRRLPDKFLKEDLIQALIDAGALDGFTYNRATLTANLANLLQYRKISGNQIALLAEIEPKIVAQKEWPLAEKIKREIKALGPGLATHPLDSYQGLIRSSQSGLMTSQAFFQQGLNRRAVLLLLVEEVRVIETKRGDLMAFVTGSDSQGQVKLVVFPDAFTRYQSFLEEGQVIQVTGRVDKDRQQAKQLIVQIIQPPPALTAATETTDQPTYQKVFIRLDPARSQPPLDQLKEIALAYSGPLAIILVDSNQNTWQLDAPYQISSAYRAQQALFQLFGKDNVIFR